MENLWDGSQRVERVDREREESSVRADFNPNLPTTGL